MQVDMERLFHCLLGNCLPDLIKRLQLGREEEGDADRKRKKKTDVGTQRESGRMSVKSSL